MGAGAIPRPKPLSNGFPFPNPRGTAEGASGGGGPGGMDGPGTIGTLTPPTNGPGVKATLGDSTGGTTPTPPIDEGKTGV